MEQQKLEQARIAHKQFQLERLLQPTSPILKSNRSNENNYSVSPPKKIKTLEMAGMSKFMTGPNSREQRSKITIS